MGCTASKLDNEDTVRRCKERRRLIKDAVFSRHHLAAAHADYCRSLRLTGTSLSLFSAGEPLLLVSPQTPSVLLSSAAATSHPPPPFKIIPPSPAPSSVYHHRPPPPPPPPESAAEEEGFSPTIASSKLPHILSASSRPSSIKTKRQSKIPHILSDSSMASTPMSYSAAGKFGFPAAEATYVSTPSQASSVWNWENFYPPSPPDSEFFNPKNDAVSEKSYHHAPHQHHHKQQYNNYDDVAVEEEEREREEVHCSEWGDHYSTTSSDTDDDDAVDEIDGDDERETRSGVSRSNFDSSSVRSESSVAAKQQRPAAVNMMGKVDENRSEDGMGSTTSSMRWKNGKEVCGSEDMRIVVRHKDLKEIVGSLQDYFDKAASAGDQVSEMLETGRAQLDRSFTQLKSMSHLLYSFVHLIDWLLILDDFVARVIPILG